MNYRRRVVEVVAARPPRRLGHVLSFFVVLACLWTAGGCHRDLPPVAGDDQIDDRQLAEDRVSPIELVRIVAPPVPRKPIQIDGDMEDWGGISPLGGVDDVKEAADESSPETVGADGSTEAVVASDSVATDEPMAPRETDDGRDQSPADEPGEDRPRPGDPPVSRSPEEGGGEVPPGIEAEPGFVDLGRIWAAVDPEWIYLRFEIGRVSNLQNLDGTVSIYFDVDGRGVTGKTVPPVNESPGLPGADMALKFSPLRTSGDHEGWAGEILEAGSPPTPLNPYELEILVAPTYASDEFEMRIARGITLPGSNVVAFAGESFGLKMVAVQPDGEVIGQAGAHHVGLVPMRNGRVMEAGSSPRDLTRRIDPRGRSLRFVSWNAYRGGLFARPEPFAAVLQALDPEVICFQELGDQATRDDLREWLAVNLPYPLGWEIVMRPDLGLAIASKMTGLEVGPRGTVYTDQGRRARLLSFLIAIPGQRILVTCAHFTCCGGMDDERDRARLDEAAELHDLIRAIRYTDDPQGIVIMGDFNLVGSRRPLDRLITNNDVDGSDLLDVAPLVVDGMTNITWRDPNQPFSPGRLDFALVSDAVFRVTKAFVLDTERLDEATLNAYGLQPGDTTDASDHLPLVVDVEW